MSEGAYRFSLRFRLPKYGLIGDPPADFVFYEREETSVRLRSSGRIEGLRVEDARTTDLVPYTLVGDGYRTSGEAEEAGWQWKGALLAWASSRRVPVDFHLGTSSAPETERVDEDYFNVLLNILPDVRTPVEDFNGPITSYFDLGRIDDKGMLAMELYTASFLDSSLTSQFVTRVTAIEALIKQPNSSRPMLDVISNLQGLVKALSLDDWERLQLNTALERQKTNSITRSGAALVDGLLPDYLYDGVGASKLFKRVYKTRSTIVHTGNHGMTKDSFTVLTQQCGALVGDVLTAYVLGRC